MSVTVGWLGLENPVSNIREISEDGDGVSISGRLAIAGSPDLEDLKKQVLGLADQPWLAHPVVFDAATHLSGWYYVDSVSVKINPGGLEIGYWPYDIKLRRCARTRTPVIESRIVGALRTNGQSHTATLPWQAVPPGGTLESGPSGLTAPAVVQADAGPVKIYDAGATGLFDSFIAWRVPPEAAMVGAARILSGPSSGANTTAFAYNAGSQNYVVPAGVTQVSVDVRGAQGGNLSGRDGGKGARVTCLLTVTPGETLTVLVGGKGGTASGAGGYNGGGAAGRGVSSIPGSGGGGMSQIKRGSTNLAVAGGGGGVGSSGAPSVKLAPGAGGYNGTSGSGVKSGQGGSQFFGGAGGKNSDPNFQNGFAGAASSGGAGGSYAASTGLGGGGGGGGVYGGGGGASWTTFDANETERRAGSGGGGSSMGSGVVESFVAGYQDSHGEVLIAPVLDALPVRLSTCTGLASEGSPFGWQIENGMVRVTPVFRSDAFQLDVSGWNGSAWTAPVRWQLTDAGVTSTPAAATITGVNVIYNEPERCSIVVSMESGAKAQSITATLTVRRGSTLVDVMSQSSVAKGFGFGLAVSGASGSSAVTGGGALVQTGTGTANNRWMLATANYFMSAVTAGFSGYYSTINVTRLTVGVGLVTSPADPVPVSNRWFSATSSTVRVVSR